MALFTYTFKTAQDAVNTRIRETDSKLLPLVNVKKHINDIHTSVLKEKHYRFMDNVISFDTSQDVTLGEDITTATTDFDVDNSTGLPAAATLSIDDDVVAYTGNAANNLTGVTGIGSAHESGTKVIRIYSIVTDLGITDFDKPIYLSINENEIQYYDGRGGIDSTKYKIDDDDFLYMPFNSESKRMVFKYKRLVTPLTADSDTFLIPDDYITLVVEFAIYKSKMDLGYADTDISNHFNEYTRIKKRMKHDLANQTENKNRRFKSIYQSGHIRT